MDADAIFLYPTLHRTTTKDCGFFCFVLALQGHYFVWQWLYCILYYVFGANNIQMSPAYVKENYFRRLGDDWCDILQVFPDFEER